MFSLKIKVFSIILLSAIFTGEEIAKDSKIHITFRKYAKMYYNFPCHTYFLFPRCGQDSIFKNRIGNLDFLINLIKVTSDSHVIAVLFVYVSLFSQLIYRGFNSGHKARGFFYLTTSVFNMLSFFIPQYVFLIGKYSSYKGLLRLNFETGFYLSNYSNEEKKIKTLEDLGKDIPNEENECAICEVKLVNNVDEDKPMSADEIKKTVTALECNHYFHIQCLAPWLKIKKKPTCPLCRRNVDKIIKGQQKNYLKVENVDDHLMFFFFGNRNFFSTMMYADVTLCLDNSDIVVNNPSETYWFVEIILLRLGAKINSPAFTYTFHPFIGFCGISVHFYHIFILSFVPTYMIKDSLSIYPGKILLDIHLTFNWGGTTFSV